MTDTIPRSPAGAPSDGPARQTAGQPQAPLQQRTPRPPRLRGATRPTRPTRAELRSRLELAAPGASARISEWVAANFQAETVGGATVYDLS
ncbi:hypothetical protein [Arthrobacter sp. NPDC057013]|uniref:hypothetical protein n=1 Tax=Arthrobacter sp. NPDC057013 TaxID=3345999 RepID=UPI00363B83B0